MHREARAEGKPVSRYMSTRDKKKQPDRVEKKSITVIFDVTLTPRVEELEVVRLFDCTLIRPVR